MQLIYLNHHHTQIVAHLDAGETLGDLGNADVASTGYIKVDGADPNYVVLLEMDPFLETVIDPGTPVAVPAPGGGVAPGTEAPPPDQPPPEGQTETVPDGQGGTITRSIDRSTTVTPA
jgi:hypothetical protein